MKALIAGATGQDGTYLAAHLLALGHEVVGTTRDAGSADTGRLRALGIDGQLNLVSMLPSDYRSVLRTLAQHRPDHIYFLAGQTSVGLSFDQPVEAIESIATGTLNVLEAIRFVNPEIRLFNAGSSECFGDTGTARASEQTPFRPLSPYAVAKVTAQNLVTNYRIAYDLYACTGVLFNHESPLRPDRFVTQKIIRGAHAVAIGKTKQLSLGNLDISRDWGWAPEYVTVMVKMLAPAQPTDLVIATGRSVSLSYFVERAFRNFDLDWREFVRVDDALRRPSDIHYGAGDPSLAKQVLGWSAQFDVDYVVDQMCAAVVRSAAS
ncbi:GDP-mannose 4,6-dehydratase [Casimicrobium huifangae]|uniref:GDP-mannose 4,6-dehydratase n=1 Tax=Casimicrobium huifangae TaxID=2591109 RepID=UPI0012EBA72E|nr:GDP-mannose 4,6-dehydratase [Casimicrobium huifangae]